MPHPGTLSGTPIANPLSPHVGQPFNGAALVGHPGPNTNGQLPPMTLQMRTPPGGGPGLQTPPSPGPQLGGTTTAPAPPPSQPTAPTPQTFHYNGPGLPTPQSPGPQLGGGMPGGGGQMGNIMQMLSGLFGGGQGGGMNPGLMQMLGSIFGGGGMNPGLMQMPGSIFGGGGQAGIHPMSNGISSAYSQSPGNLMFGRPQAQPYSFFQPPGTTGPFTPPAGTRQRTSGQTQQTPPSIGMNGLGGGMRRMGGMMNGMGGELGGLPGAGNIQY